MRRDKLNEQFMELGTTLDPDRPRHDKATILGDTVQMLKDLTSQVNKLKAEYSSLFEEECELTKEKNELRSEKASLKSDVDNLNNHYQQRIQMLYPCTTMEPSVLIGPPPSYPFSLQVPIPAGAVTMHPQLQPCPFFQNQTLGAISNPCTPYMAYSQSCHAPSDQPSSQFSTPVLLSSSNRSHSPAQGCRSKSPSLQQASCGGRNDDFGDVATDLELKTTGSSAPSHSEITNKDSSSDLKMKKQCIKLINGSTLIEDSSSSRCS
uniref:BHLH domain-containing protein n=4 Tax=Triticinae TaxID=1648030 RepID=A0A453NXF3_AEGTS